MTHKLILFILIAFFLSSCEAKKEDDIAIFQFEKPLSDIKNNEQINFYIESDTVKVNVIKTRKFISIQCKNGKRVYRKKKFRLHQIKNSEDLELAKSIIAFNEDLKSNHLIGLISKLVTIEDKDYLFQEEIGKRLIESNSKREGVILKIEFASSTIIESIKGEKINQDFIGSIVELIDSNKLNTKYFSATNWTKFQKVAKKYFKNITPNYYYLNPVTYKLEPIFSGVLVNGLSLKDPEIHSPEISLDFLSFFKYLEDSNTLVLKNKNTLINEKIIIPKGHNVILKGGETIDLINSGSILSYSSFTINGKKAEMVKIKSSDSSGQGLHIIQINDSSKINFLEFSNQFSLYDTLKYNNQILPSAFTIYGGGVSIKNSVFSNLKSEDAVNLFRTNFYIDRMKIENTFSDAFDADFCNGFMKNCSFINCGNDGVDISGGNLEISESKFLNIKDKAISAGEESNLKAIKCSIKNSSMGIISKDLSVVESIENKLLDCEIGYCAFQKKGEFGPGEIYSSNDKITNCSVDHLIEQKSKLTINGERIKVFQNNVIDYLYGKKYGKATFKKN